MQAAVLRRQASHARRWLVPMIAQTRHLRVPDWVEPCDKFLFRHIGPDPAEIQTMLRTCSFEDLDDMIAKAVPEDIRLRRTPHLDEPLTESEVLERLKQLGSRNQVFRSYIGMGYYGTLTPTAIKRNVLENPGWYTPYTPYQAEIAQGRMESLLNFQTMIQDLTSLPIANASLLDEATAGAEALSMCFSAHNHKRKMFLLDSRCHPQTEALVYTRAKYIGAKVIKQSWENFEFTSDVCGCLVQYPDTHGEIHNIDELVAKAHDAGALVACATDLLALTVMRSPGEFGADIAVGSAQRFGVPLGYGGPHAAFMSCTEKLIRRLPGRLIGVTRDTHGNRAYRLSLQTRENHIRRERATSNICTAQALLANMAAMYAVFHGPQGLKNIANRVHYMTSALADSIADCGHAVNNDYFFDTIKVTPVGLTQDHIMSRAHNLGINLRQYDDGDVGISLDETVTTSDLRDVMSIFTESGIMEDEDANARLSNLPRRRLGELERTSSFLTHPIFNKYHSETELMRYCKHLENKDISLVHSMIPLGSCTMKLNAATEMQPVTWPEFANIHPFAPPSQAQGFIELFEELARDLCAVTGYDAVSLQPNSGAQGEIAGMLAIRGYLESKGEGHRDVCLIPESAHGTNPATATMCGMRVAKVRVTKQGDIDMDHLREQCEKHKNNLAAIMITYPSTYGVFDESVREICETVHGYGAQVYLDGANMNAQMMLCRPGDYGSDVSHLNLHKTFCIPHGGGGPGMGPIGVKSHLAPFLPGHVMTAEGHKFRQVSASPYGSSLIMPISWSYIRMMGAEGLRMSSAVAILNANYMAHRLKDYYEVAFRGKRGCVAHEFIVSFAPFKKYGITCTDVAKRLQDYGFHSPTVSWPVPDSLMIEPTESESKDELDRYVDALIQIRHEIQEVMDGKYPQDDNVIVNAPHPQTFVLAEEWTRPYSREKAAYPVAFLKEGKTWPGCGRVDDAFGDKNLMCSCPPMDSYDA
ncbi:glycine decarboxylase multi-enzyme complex P subunit [Salpingoeca rosetta]|uniref:Glycine cleavage system P protein n=1 Tax=Salpingoeca rosetta (strain ATCC 50818 / BSB-021) TaxID=946362 RepID=F2UHM6_SALR5|nr:glycine decarboxylase multi-enzyme complex P subunit [Salpingoeca rosetta]EGD76625.1 glycine decarboxylase multi-enzyme complex P subunit [Salpingoeca rosetta]|eukprot:XP_004991539.1 glycine decarboxylase multi-enzyme complex P subunit [Salpingoeca rosetta]